MKKKRMLVIPIILIAFLCVSEIFAYLTDMEQTTNTFTLGDIKITLTQPNYDTEEAAKISPNKVIDKDPTITNVGKNDAYIFAKVEMPYYSATSVGQSAATDTELFSLINSAGTTGTNTGWTQLSRTADMETHKVTYLYAYTGAETSTMETVEKGEEVVLFNKARFANLKDYSELTSDSDDTIIETFDLKVEAYAIQKDLASNEGVQITNPESVWAIIQNSY